MKIDQEQVQLMKRRGGVGHDLSHIRPTGSPVKNSALTSTGIVPFIDVAPILPAKLPRWTPWCPDAHHFCKASGCGTVCGCPKLEQGKVTGANVSVKIDDDFMQSVVNKTPYRQQYPIHSTHPSKVQEIDALGLWNKIIHNTWKSAEPGVLLFNTLSGNQFPIATPTWGLRPCRPILAVEVSLCN